VLRQNGNAKVPQAGFQIRVCGLRVYNENKFTKLDVSFKVADSLES
jgi:hypothetical protein